MTHTQRLREAFATLADEAEKLLAHMKATGRMRECFNWPALAAARAALAEAPEAGGPVAADGRTQGEAPMFDQPFDDSDRLKPCPFCGGEAEAGYIDTQDHPDEGGRFIACLKCDASTGLRFACGDDPMPLLFEQWNSRAAPPAPAPLVALTEGDFAIPANLPSNVAGGLMQFAVVIQRALAAKNGLTIAEGEKP